MDHGNVLATDLACCLRTWRDRLDPAEIGLQAGRLRRAPGLRREELAQLAGVSVDYLARLEQGRASSPSPSVLAPLARALRLTEEERDHLYRIAGQAPPSAGRINRHLTPGVQRVIDRLTDTPVLVVDPASTTVALNPLAVALIGEDYGSTDRHPRNHPWSVFTGHPSRAVRTPEQEAALQVRIVADLHLAVGRHHEDEDLRTLIDDLRAESPRFAELWDDCPIAGRREDRKTYLHPEVGPVTVDCDVMTVDGSDLRIIVYTAAPGSPDAAALALLGAIGTQRFSA